MKPKIKTIPEKIFVGHKIEMSFVNNRTLELWKQLMPRRKEIKKTVLALNYIPLRFNHHLFLRISAQVIILKNGRQ